MKIEMGESLFYSWLRHVKDCQIVQTNWKPSPKWSLQHTDKLDSLWHDFSDRFETLFGYKIFKKTASLSQFLQQAECDVLGICIQNGETQYYAVDVAFHEDGLNYGSREETVAKIVSKCIRTAFCLYGYMDASSAQIVFASPKISPSVISDVSPCINLINRIFADEGFHFEVRIISNNDFNTLVLTPILMASDGIADTSELFLRSYQLFSMFQNEKPPHRRSTPKTTFQNASCNELKIGRLAQTVLRNALESNVITLEELQWLQTAQYSKQMFDLQYPLLVSEHADFDPLRYYVRPLTIHGERFYMCSQWFETPTNNDRPYLMQWLTKHTDP